MRLIQINIAAFQCIQSAEVSLGKGLNILYGPNDHGKSTLAAAIRAALLLPHSSRSHEDLLSWHTGESPSVTLSFSTEEQRYWRVRKVFGKGGSSTLESSKDGLSYVKDIDARQVDDKLRELLRWGVAKPGGTGGSKGLPESFLTTVLLAEQSNVPAILEMGLNKDREESGRERLNQALQALAQEPLFKQVLDAATSKIGKAFTSGGKLTKAKGSPLQERSAAVAELSQEVEELQKKINATTTIEDSLRILQEELSVLVARLTQRNQELAHKQQGLSAAQARMKFEEELQTARQHLSELQKGLDEVKELSRSLQEMDGRLEELEAQRKAGEVARGVAESALRESEQRFQEATSDQGAQERKLRAQQLENERLQIQSRISELQGFLTGAETARTVGQEAAVAGAALQALREQIIGFEQEMAARAGEEQELLTREDRLKLVREFALFKEARRRHAEAQASADQASSLLAEGLRLRKEADESEAKIQQSLPSLVQVAGLRQLWHQLEVEEARLGGGVSVMIQPRRELSMQISVDGGGQETRSGTQNLEVQRSLQLRIEDLLDITVTAGDASVRQQVESLRGRWVEQGQPALDKAGCQDVSALAAARAKADLETRQVQDLRSKAAGLESSAQEHHLRAQNLAELVDRLQEREGALAGQELGALESDLGSQGESELDRRLAAAAAERRTVAAKLDEIRTQRSVLQGRLEGDEATYTKLQQRAVEAAALYPSGIEAALETGAVDLSGLTRASAQNALALENLQSQASSQAEQARLDVEAASLRLTQTTTLLKDIESNLSELNMAKAKAQGVHEERLKVAQSYDLASGLAAVSGLELQLSQLPAGLCSQAEVEAAEQAAREVQQSILEKEKELNQAQWSLLRTGGDVVRDQKLELDQALERAVDKEHEIEVEYRAWKLLADTLREVENSEGAHLGRAFSGPVGVRLQALCGGRYGDLSIDAHLKSEGLQAAGQVRAFESLSEGTKDQLATLFRLGIAEHLGSTIILDDHLNQSDHAKIEWFLNLLRETGEKIQVVLITCRPDDYLAAEERPAAGEPFLDASGLRAVNLGHTVRRYALSK